MEGDSLNRTFGKKVKYWKRGKRSDRYTDPYRREDGDRNRSKFRKSKGSPRGRGKKHALYLLAVAVASVTGADAAELINFPDFFQFDLREPDTEFSVTPEQDDDFRFYEYPPQSNY